MREKNVVAYFSTSDDALSAETSLRAIGGVQNLQTERRYVSDDSGPGLYALYNGSSSSLMPTAAAMPGPFAAFLPVDDVDDARSGDPVQRQGSKQDVVLTCKVDVNKLQEVVDAIIRAGGSVAAS